MYRPAVALAAALLSVGPALAQNDRGNAAQPERAVPQTGQTSGGPAQTPATPGPAPAPGAATRSPGASTGAADSAKGGNAAETNKPVPNTGGTSGGPAR